MLLIDISAIWFASAQPFQASTQKPGKMNGPIYQLHPTSVIQIPVAPKEQNTPTANNIVVNNGYFINGAFIKLQQMLTQQQVSRPFAWHSSLHAFKMFFLCEVPCSGNPFGRAPHIHINAHVLCSTLYSSERIQWTLICVGTICFFDRV